MIGIGALYGGPEQEGSPIDLLVSATMQAAEDVCGEWESMTTPRVNVNFCVPGSIEGYDDITKIDVGTISRKQRAVVVRVPVPREVAKAGGSAQFIADSLLEACRLAADVFARKGIHGFELAKAMEAVDQIKHLVQEKLTSLGVAPSSMACPIQEGARSDATCSASGGKSSKRAESLSHTVEEKRADEGRRGKTLSAPSSSADMIKLYKCVDGGRLYWEAWDAGDQSVTVHWGTVGEVGRTKRVPVPVNQSAEDVILRESQSPRSSDYGEIDVDEQFQIVVQFRTDNVWGDSSDLEKCYRLEEILNECLGWTGNGNCDGSDIGSGTINCYSFVVDPYLAKVAIVEALRENRLLDGAVIAVQREDEYEVLWPSDFLGEFTVV